MFSSSALSIFTLSIYTLFLVPILFCALKHRRPGLLGWTHLFIFCSIRIGSSILQIPSLNIRTTSSHDAPSIALLLNNVALAPLLLCAAGLLYESRTARDPGMPKRLEYIKIALYHAAVVVSILLLIIGFLQLPDTTPPAQANGFMKIGIAGMLICGCMLASWVFASFDVSVEENYMEAPGHGDGTRLLHTIIFALPPLTLRFIYAALMVFLPPSKFETSIVANVIMLVVAEIIAVGPLVIVGIWTRKIGCRRRASAPADIYPQDDEVVWEPKF